MEASVASEDFVAYRKDVSAKYEDGTVAFLSIATLGVSFDVVESLGGMRCIQSHCFAIAAWLARELLQLRHSNGRNAFVVYGHWRAIADSNSNNNNNNNNDDWSHRQGAIVSFNGVRADGTWVGYSEIGKLAALHKIIVRTGCFCNAGACEQWLSLSPDAVRRNLSQGHVCWDDRDVIEGVPTGAVRASFGWSSTMDDARKIVAFLRSSFLVETSTVMSATANPSLRATERGSLSQLFVYPVKSCGGMSATSWPIGPRGLLYDREWALVGPDGTYLSQKSVPFMSRIDAAVDLRLGLLTLTAPAPHDPLVVPISGVDRGKQPSVTVSVCGDACNAFVYGVECCSWFERVLGQPCTLVRLDATEKDSVRRNANTRGSNAALRLASSMSASAATSIAFANECQFLLVSNASLRALQERLSDPRHGDVGRFRANFVVDNVAAHAEDRASAMRIAGQMFLSSGPCARCEMVCVDAQSLTRSREPLRTLSSYRRIGGRILFGALFAHDTSASVEPHVVSVGDAVELLDGDLR